MWPCTTNDLQTVHAGELPKLRLYGSAVSLIEVVYPVFETGTLRFVIFSGCFSLVTFLVNFAQSGSSWASSGWSGRTLAVTWGDCQDRHQSLLQDLGLRLTLLHSAPCQPCSRHHL
jgi:hypothetical protein